MTRQIVSAGAEYTKGILLSVKEMTETKFACDFTIKVDDKSFPVHRNIISAASKYFEAMFSSEMIESHQGFADIKTIESDVMQKCINFMYTGDVELEMTEIQDMLHASNLLQLDELTELCFEYLQRNISTNNCLLVAHLAKVYDEQAVLNQAETIVINNLEKVIHTTLFLQISLAYLSYYITKSMANHEVKWKAITTWFATRQKRAEALFPQVLKTVENFPFNFLLKTVLNEALVKNNKHLTNLVTNSLFSNDQEFKRNLDVKNFLSLLHMKKTGLLKKKKQIKKIMREFMIENFEQVVHSDEFVDIEEDEILFVFKTLETNYFNEKTKWNAALMWCKHQSKRAKVFPKLFELIKLDDLPFPFIQQVVRYEPLVRESRECAVVMMDTFSARADEEKQRFSSRSRRNSFVSDAHLVNNFLDSDSDESTLHLCHESEKIHSHHIVFLNRKNGQIGAWNVNNNTWHYLPKAQRSNPMQILNLNNDLYLMCGNQIFLLEKNKFWVKKAQITEKLKWNKLVSFQRKMYLVQKDTMLCLDPVCHEWEDELPGCKLGDRFCVTTSNRFLYALGGMFTNRDAMRFDPKTREWSKLRLMRNGRDFSAASVLDGRIYVTGGCKLNFTSPDSVQCYTQSIRSWDSVSDMCVERCGHFTCVVDGKLYAIGGQSTFGKFTNSMEVYDADSDSWSLVNIEHFPKDTPLAGCVYFM